MKSHLDFSIDALEPRKLFAATLTSGESYLTSIKTPGQQKNWTIPLVAGQNITLAAAKTTSGSFQTELILISPQNKAVRRSTTEIGTFISFNVPTSGNWRVRVRDVGANDTAGIRVTAFYHAPTVTDSDSAADGGDFVAQSGRRRPATIEPGDLDVWTFDATANQFLSILATENSAGNAVDIGMLIIGPDGRVVGGGENEKGVKFDIPSSKAGRYYVVIYEGGANDTGRYGISFARAPGTQYSGDPDTVTPLQNNVPRNGDLPGGDLDIWPISLGQGDVFTGTMTRGTGSLDPELLLISPTGTVVTTANGATSATVAATATTAGTYWLIARDREADDGGQYTVKYTVS